MNDVFVEQFISVAFRVAAMRAKTTAARYRLATDAGADLRQELLLELWRKRSAFDPQRASWRTYSEAIAANKMTSLLRKMRSHRSGRFKERSIEEAALVAAPAQRHELSADVKRVLATVSNSDQKVAGFLRHCSPAETSRKLGITPAKVYRAIARLRVAFTAAGLAHRSCGHRREVRK